MSKIFSEEAVFYGANCNLRRKGRRRSRAVESSQVNGELVLTTAQLAKFYGCSNNNIVKTFQRHKEEFIEGEHYLKLTGEALRDFKREMTDCHSVTNGDFAVVNPNATVFYLWTTLGAARFAKSLKTKKAWEVYEQLALNYFSGKKISGKKSAEKISKNELTAEKKIKFLLQAAKITKDTVRRENLISIAEKIIIGI